MAAGLPRGRTSPGGAPNHRGCIYIRFVLFCQMLKCVFDNNHCIGERREMSTQILPAASLRTGDRLPAGRVLIQVSKYLVWMALSSIYWSIRGAVSIFLPEAGRPGVPRLGRGAVASGRVVQRGWLLKQARSASPRRNCTRGRCCRRRSWPVRRPAPRPGSPPGFSAIGETSTRCADSPSPTSCCRRR
jgi:hypothetical protein